VRKLRRAAAVSVTRMQNNGTLPVIDRALGVAADHERAGRTDAAELLYREVLAVDPANATALAGLGALTPRAGAAPRSLVRRAARRAGRAGLEAVTRRARLWKYDLLSTCPRVSGAARKLQPVLFVGPGEIVLGDGVQLGWPRSPLFHTGYCHLEAASATARIELGDRVEFNNNAFLKSEGAGIRVGADGLFGASVEIFDSNFHDLDPARRRNGTARTAPVEIGENVFVGMGVRILKGVTIGADSVIGAGAVVTTSIPAAVIAGGNPARVIREL
jgi:acetyltransferase-like isoleucine patch superfamily enzyme